MGEGDGEGDGDGDGKGVGDAGGAVGAAVDADVGADVGVAGVALAEAAGVANEPERAVGVGETYGPGVPGAARASSGWPSARARPPLAPTLAALRKRRRVTGCVVPWVGAGTWW